MTSVIGARQVSARRRVAAGAAAAVIAATLSTVVAGPAQAANIAPLLVGPRPNATRVDFRVGDRVDASVDVGTGNLLVTTTELTVPGIGGDVQVGLDFNSLLLGAGSPLPYGAAGYGWASRIGQDSKLVLNTDLSVVYFAPGGAEGKYVPAAGSTYTSPAGFKNSLVKTGATGWTLTDHGSGSVSTFSSAGVLTSVTDRNGQVTALTYASGRLATLTSTRGGTSSRKVTVALGSQGLFSTVTQASDVSGSRSVTYGYTGSQLSSITDAASRITGFGYTGGGQGFGGDLTSITNTGGVATTIGYDTSHRVTSVSRANPGGTAALTRFTYPSGSQTLVAGPNTNPGLPVASVPHTTYTLDATARVTTALDPLSRSRSASYTPFADIASTTSPGGGLTSTTHGANAGESLTGVTAPTGATASLSYTGTGSTAFLPTGGSDTQGNPAVVTYDGVGNPLSSANSTTAATASVTYHGDGTLATSTDPATKVTTYAENTATGQTTGITPPTGSGLGNTGLTYDGYARLSTVTDGRGDVTTYSYDLLDRVTGISYSGPGIGTTAIGYGYDTAGNRHTRTDASGTTTYGYDGLNRLTSRVATAGGGTLSYGYDPAGNTTSNVNGRGTTSYTYDDANQLSTRTAPRGTVDYYAYTTDGKRSDTWWRSIAAHTTFAAHTHTDYDAAGRIARTWTSRASSDTTRVFDASYCDSPYTGGACPTTTSATDKGVIQWSVDNLTAARSIYTYDGANRVTDVTNYGGHHYAYGYDANGNRTTRTVDGVLTQTLTVNAGNQITTTGYSYDMAGNQSADPTAGTLTYNTAGQMTASTGTTNTYAGPGHNELTHQNLPASVTYDYTYGRPSTAGVPTLDSLTKNGATTYIDNDPTTGTPTGFYLPIGQADYLVTDGQGSTIAIISADTGGTLVATYSYDPYGLQTGSTGTGAAATTNPYRQAAGLRDPATGWNRHGTRYNDTTTGRWTTQDPITRLADPNNANPYTYSNDNPVNKTDPTGTTAGGCIAGYVGVVGAFYAAPETLGLSMVTGVAGLYSMADSCPPVPPDSYNTT